MKFPSSCVIVLIAFASIGCGSSPLSMYPNFPAYKGQITTGALLADCVIIDDMIGDTNKIDVVANKSLGGMLLVYFTDKLSEKGYRVDNTVLTSVGLTMDRQHVYKLNHSVRSRETNIEDLPIGIPPFYLNDIFGNETSAAALWSTYDALIKAVPEGDSPKTVIPFASVVGRRAEASTLMIVFLGGFNVAASKEYNEELTSTTMTVGGVAMQHISQVTVAFYIVDAQTGEIRWSDQRFSKGGTVYKEKILRLADKIIDDLP